MFERLDAAVERAGVRDAQEHRLDGFPYLRINRFTASFRDAARNDAGVRHAMLKGMAALDLHARQFESANLPLDIRAPLGELPLEKCSRVLTTDDLGSPARMAALLDAAQVPDAYADWKRALGLYPLTSVPFRWGVRRWEDSTTRTFAAAPATPLARWLPPLPDATLVTRHAPAFEIDMQTPDDRFGAPKWTQDGVGIDVDVPVVFSQVTHTRFAGQTLTQLVYTLWFPSRPAEGPFDLLSGHLDALVIRITLDLDGQILLADSIHACGCYHQFFPSARLAVRAPPDSHQEWAFSPAALPTIREGQRLVFRIASGTHYLTGLTTMAVDETSPPRDPRYALRPADSLRSLPLPEGHGRRSLYGPDGLVAGTERGERFLFWPMGIASPGSLRQAGLQATAFVGRRHFDDADLIERRFMRVDPAVTRLDSSSRPGHRLE